MTTTTQDILARSPTARASARLELGAGRSISVWDNQNDRVSYRAPTGHTFSLYLHGGTGTRRLDAGGRRGWPGAVSIMPDGVSSEWAIRTPMRFVHFHAPDDILRAAFARTHECDARRLAIDDRTFVVAPTLAGPLARMATAAEAGDILLADTACAELVARLPEGEPCFRGGLAPHLLRRIDDWIDAEMHQPIRLSDLASLADLSEFHLHRMFRLARGLAPHAWVSAQRVNRAKDLLRTDLPIAEIAVTCGFSSQSHMTRIFKRQCGLTPARYRQLFQCG
ncbi:MAG: AraC family transcriptional regulator [Alphaproteobacteria bacterium]|nr:AraC family transcriptional regulator [Alphaproteobacteria bacterium]